MYTSVLFRGLPKKGAKCNSRSLKQEVWGHSISC